MNSPQFGLYLELLRSPMLPSKRNSDVLRQEQPAGQLADAPNDLTLHRGWLGPWICAAALFVLRIILLPLNTDFPSAFSHDSAYIAIVARNLLSGKGWVNDASWLVFLHPARLPMPYHNANPLYPLLTAVAAKVLGLPVVRAGLLVSALASVGLFLASFYLASYWMKSDWSVLLIALAVTVFPPLWQCSLRMLPDALTLTLLIAGLAFFVRAERYPLCIAAGIVFGAAWLTRSTASLIAPALVVYAFAAWTWPKAILRLTLAGVAALVVAAPWLIHTAHVWGSPLRSDATYYAFQDFYARPYGGSIDRYWRSPELPPPPMQLIRSNGAGAILTHVVTGIPRVIMGWFRDGWERRYVPRIVLLVLLASVALRFRRHFLTPAFFASVVYAGLQIVVMALRSDSFEPRYLAPLTALMVLWLGCGIATLLAGQGLRGPARYALILGIAFLACYVPFQDAVLVRQNAQDSPVANRRRVRRSISAQITHLDPVVVFDPYFYTFDTGAQALSIPQSSDDYLLRYMEQYNSRWIILSDDDVSFWEPQWRQELPPWLKVRGKFEGNILFERVPPS